MNEKKDLRACDVAGCTVAVCDGEHCHHGADRLLQPIGEVICATHGGILVRSECLGACGHAPLVVVHRRATLVEPAVTVALRVGAGVQPAVLADWVGAGGPGVAAMPAALDPCVVAVS